MSIKIKKSHEGRLHKALGVKEGQPISLAQEEAALSKAKKDHNTRLIKELTFALNARKFAHRKKK